MQKSMRRVLLNPGIIKPSNFVLRILRVPDCEDFQNRPLSPRASALQDIYYQPVSVSLISELFEFDFWRLLLFLMFL